MPNDKKDTVMIDGMPLTEDIVKAMPNGDALWTDGLTRKAALIRRKRVQTKIAKDVGDTDSILGTTNDVSQLAAAGLLALISALNHGDSFRTFRNGFIDRVAALIPDTEGGASVFDQADAFLAGVQSGDIVLTAGVKGFENVLSDMAQRSTGTAAILLEAGQSET